MTRLQQLQLRESEIKRRLAEIGGLDELTDEQESEAEGLQREYKSLQTRMQAAIVAEAEELAAAQFKTTPDGESAELSELIGRASVAEIVTAHLQHRMTDGAESELQEHFNLQRNQIPLALLFPAAEQPAARQERALTMTAADTPAMQQGETVQPVYPMGEAEFCGVEAANVPAGQATYPVISVPAAGAASVPDAVAAAASVGDTDQTLQLSNLSPNRIQRSITYQQEQARLFANLASDLRRNIAEQVMAARDRFALLNGTKGLLTRGSAPADATAQVSWATWVALLAGQVDGVYARRLRDVRALVRTTTFARLAAVYRDSSTNSQNAIDWTEDQTAGLMASAYPPTGAGGEAGDDQLLVIRGRWPRSAVIAQWDGVELDDPYSDSATGTVRLTVASYIDFAVLRPDVFVRSEVQTTS